jgi:hypothetical protein
VVSKGRAGRMSDHVMVPLNGPPLHRFPAHRVCAECATVLSIYNDTEFCSLHERSRKLPVNRVV